MARWLLYIHDRIDGNFIPLTQEALSELLGVRRTTVTLVGRKLRASGAVRSARRGLVEIFRWIQRRLAFRLRRCAKFPAIETPFFAEYDKAQRDTLTQPTGKIARSESHS